MTPEADIVIAVPLAASSMVQGTRVVAIDGDHVCHVFTRRRGEELVAPDLSFTARTAMEIAVAVLAGDTRACTSPDVLRILAAAYLTCALDEETSAPADTVVPS